ncbi:hypothetical protein GCM10010215_50200 [Streptomyces virginiae]|uniref:Uncharacterized protein n=1 Tax=Streptomyces virginiae TaxID=1961 RepID=A0ABQ3NQ09_STRVG|nr:hypothetical protein GCM10010215_50200 [Streptomyces virginiae]GHI14850.1 hypothetical protein Scinn_43130 [Streptomyces virginiae]
MPSSSARSTVPTVAASSNAITDSHTRARRSSGAGARGVVRAGAVAVAVADAGADEGAGAGDVVSYGLTR